MHSQTPLVVCWGMGQDSTGMLVGMWEGGIRPKLIITADVGSELRKDPAPLLAPRVPSLGVRLVIVIPHRCGVRWVEQHHRVIRRDMPIAKELVVFIAVSSGVEW